MMRIGDIVARDLEDLDPRRLRATIQSSATLTVSEDESAVGVARKAEERKVALVVTMDAQGNPTGILAPAVAKERIAQYLGIDEDTFEDTLHRMESLPEEVERGFRHEWLNHARPQLYWCDPGSHMTSENPCSKHPGS